jgi:hypothetical protein
MSCRKEWQSPAKVKPAPLNVSKLRRHTKRVKVRHMARFKCLVCDKSEDECQCQKYCALCHDDYQVRLCEDGQYYCVPCREACDYRISD